MSRVDHDSDPTVARRDVLRFSASAALLGSIASCRSTAAAPPPSAEYLARGLSALSDAHRRGWLPGHSGAAVLSAYYFCRDNQLDEPTARAIERNVDAFIAHQPGEFPEPARTGERADPTRIVEQLDLHVHELRSGGHDAIYAALALRALRDAPELATTANVDGVVKLLAAHVADRRPVTESEFQREHPLSPYSSVDDLAATTFRATLRPWHDVRRLGASGVLHWITHADAIVTLAELGYGDVARRAFAAHRVHIHQPTENENADGPTREPIDWRGRAYWESDAPRRSFGGTWLAGHAFKLPYSAFRLAQRVADQELRTAALVRASELLIPFEPRDGA